MDSIAVEGLNKVTVFLTNTQLDSLDGEVARQKGDARKRRDKMKADGTTSNVEVNVNRSYVLRALIDECLTGQPS